MGLETIFMILAPIEEDMVACLRWYGGYVSSHDVTKLLVLK